VQCEAFDQSCVRPVELDVVLEFVQITMPHLHATFTPNPFSDYIARLFASLFVPVSEHLAVLPMILQH
jgi:hypothetical protein